MNLNAIYRRFRPSSLGLPDDPTEDYVKDLILSFDRDKLSLRSTLMIMDDICDMIKNIGGQKLVYKRAITVSNNKTVTTGWLAG